MEGRRGSEIFVETDTFVRASSVKTNCCTLEFPQKAWPLGHTGLLESKYVFVEWQAPPGTAGTTPLHSQSDFISAQVSELTQHYIYHFTAFYHKIRLRRNTVEISFIPAA